MERALIFPLIKNEPYKIGHFLGFKDLTPLHNQWLKQFLFSRTDVTILGHRGSFKTTTESIFLALHSIIEPNSNVLFFRKTDNDVSEIVRQTRKILESDCIREIVRSIYGEELVIMKANDSEIHTNLCTQNRGASQIVGLGIGTSITGKHADIIMTDDIVNLRDRISRAEREKTKLQYMELQNIKNRGGRFINTGTPWHIEDAISLMPNIQRYDCYSTGLIGKDKLAELRRAMTDSLFAANYELKHIKDESAIFKNPEYFDDPSLLYGGLAHIDASYGGPDGTAYTIFNERDGVIYGFGKLWHKHVDECRSDIKLYHNMYQAGSVACEKNADKGYLARDLENDGFFVDLYSETTNKFVKISTFLRQSWHKLKWLDSTDPEYINEILDYTEHAEHDDAPDSAASLLRKMETKIKYNAITGGL